MKILWLYRQRSAVGSYRCLAPARWLKEQDYDITCPDQPYPTLKPSLQEWIEPRLKDGYDILAVDRAAVTGDLPALSGFRHLSPNCRMVVDSDDDWTQVPPWNPAKVSYQPGQTAFETGRAHFKLAEMVTVTTPTLAEKMAPRAHAVAVVPNGIDPRDWEFFPVNPERPKDPHLRILYGGAAGHYGDMDEARAGLETILENPPVPLRLICFGAIPQWLYEANRKWPDRVIRIPWVDFADYPAAVAWGGFDVAIAPLADHPFNRSKSNIKWLEAAVQGIPFLCSDVGPYAEIPMGCAVKVSNSPVQWAEGLRALLTDAEFRDRLRARAYEAVHDEWTIDKTAPKFIAAYEQALARPRIVSLEDTRLPKEV